MTVFKKYFKIMLRYKWIILMYTGICLGISIINTTSGNASTESFVASTPDVAVICNDENTEIASSFKEYISQNAKIKEIENNDEKIQDALFYRNVNYVLIIPENYTEDFMEGKNPKIEVKKTQDTYATYMEMLINRYLKIANVYRYSGMTQREITESIKKDFSKESNIIINNDNKDSISRAVLYYNFANYAFLGISIYIISILMNAFNNEKIRKRNLISKTAYSKISNQLFLGNTIFVVELWAVYIAISIILYKETMLTINGILLMISSLIFIIAAAAIGFLVSSLLKNKNAISGIVNVIALGTSFISGCFVPQEWLNEGVLNFAKFFPSYWYIKANNQIMEITNYDFNNLKPILINFGIVLCFVILYLIIIKIINKIKLKVV